MTNIVTRFFGSINSIGLNDNNSPLENRVKIFFNQVVFMGGVLSLGEVIFFYPIDLFSCIATLFVSIGSFTALYLNKINQYKLARIGGYSLILIMKALVAMRMGKEFAFHMSTVTVLVAILMTFSRKEWKSVLYLMILEISSILIVETDYFKVEDFGPLDPQFLRSFMVIGTVFFLIYEIMFAVRLNEQNEGRRERRLLKANKVLSSQNEEITVMIREIHHRVKNNLQIIVSLLRLRSHHVKDEEAKELFDTSINRIQAMSVLHTKMYQSKNIGKLDVKDYLEALTQSLIESYAVGTEVELVVNSNVDKLANENIVSFALILNELITNSLAHAFDDQDTGIIKVNALAENDKFILEYADSGTWKKETKEDSFGLDLIDLLTEQLDGTVELQKESEGTRYKFEFKELI